MQVIGFSVAISIVEISSIGVKLSQLLGGSSTTSVFVPRLCSRFYSGIGSKQVSPNETTSDEFQTEKVLGFAGSH